MNPAITCSECGRPIPADSPSGCCGQCLLKLGLQGATESDHDVAVGGVPDGPGVSSPTSDLSGTVEMTAMRIEKSGDRIGRYRLLQEIGHGGCGVVYMAEQEEPVRRRVALKVIKLGMDTRQVVARFEAERQALALMDHPNIARVLDAGAAESGRPYFVMELVRGVRITDYCDQHRLTTEERLKLFIQVCQAIQHAHQKGIIHRDIKPSNVLVTLHDGVPVPKVIDFGIAKATQGRLTDQTLFTAFEQFMGTPAYMSPEQAEMSGLDIDTRSDIYSLGVLLYELLVGSTPFAAKELLAAGLDQMRRAIREQEPMRPSTRLATMVEGDLTTAARDRQVEAPGLIHLVRGDLDWIVMKCLEKDRTRRYDTANGLARDIERHLSSEPVNARPPSAAYRVQKFVRRNRAMVSAAAAVSVVMVVGIITSTWQAVRATRAEQDQIRQRDRAELLASQAQAHQQVTRLRAYASEVSVALQAWESGHPTRARQLLERQRPKPDEDDLRGFEWRYLYGLLRPREVATLRLQEGSSEVWGSAWSPNGRYVALATYSGKVELWDWITRTRLETVPSLNLSYFVDFSPDSGRIVIPIWTEGRVGVAIWDLNSRRISREFTTVASGSPLGRFSRRGRYVAYSISRPYDPTFIGKTLICDLEENGESFELQNHQGATFPDFSMEDRWLVTPHVNGQVTLWDIESRQVVERLAGHRGVVFFARFSPDGHTLATGGIDCTVRLWDLREIPRKSIVLGTHQSTVFGLDFSPDGSLLVSASLDHTAKVWDVKMQREIDTLRGHDQRVFSASFSSDGSLIMTGSEDSSAKIWRTPDVPADQPLDHYAAERLKVLEFSSDGRWLVAEDEFGTRLYDFVAGTAITPDLLSCRISPDARAMAGLTTKGHLNLWSLVNDPPRCVASVTNSQPFHPASIPAFGPDSQTVACVSTNLDLSVWSLAGKVPALIRTFTNAAVAGAIPLFSPDGQLLVSQSSKDSVTIWDWREARQIAVLRRNPSESDVDFCIFSPDGRFFVTQYLNGTWRLWDTRRWSEVESMRLENGWQRVVFSPDSRLLATGGAQSTTFRLWDVATWTCEEFASSSGPIDCLNFSHDNRTLAVSTRDGMVSLWHLPSRQEIISLRAHRSHGWRALFSPDGRRLATSGADGNLRIWPAPSLDETDSQ